MDRFDTRQAAGVNETVPNLPWVCALSIHLDRTTGTPMGMVSASRLVQFPQQPALQLIYDTAPIGLACLSPDCRYLQINQRLTEICGISVEDHLGRFVRDCVPALADAAGVLHTAHHIARDRLGGRLTLESRPDGGTIARLTIPRLSP